MSTLSALHICLTSLLPPSNPEFHNANLVIYIENMQRFLKCYNSMKKTASEFSSSLLLCLLVITIVIYLYLHLLECFSCYLFKHICQQNMKFENMNFIYILFKI